MRLLHVIDDARPVGGAQTYLRRLAAATAERGGSNDVLAGTPPADDIAGVDRVELLRGDAAAAAAAAASLRPDAILVHTVDSAALALRLAATAPTFVYEHDYRHISPGNLRFFARSEQFCAGGFGLRCLVKPYTERCNNRRPDRVAGSIGRVLAWRRVWPRLAGVLCASPFVERLLVGFGVDSAVISVVGYPVEVPEAPVPPASKRRDVLYVGRTSAVKGLHHLVRAFALLRGRFPETHLLVAGGPDLDDVGDAAAREGVAGATELLGWLDEPGLRAAYARSRVLALPSVWPEAFGMAGLEALAHGVPVVASDVGGISTWLDPPRGGALVAPGDPVALADALGALLADAAESDRLGAAGRERAREFTAERHLERLLPVLERRER